MANLASLSGIPCSEGRCTFFSKQGLVYSLVPWLPDLFFNAKKKIGDPGDEARVEAHFTSLMHPMYVYILHQTIPVDGPAARIECSKWVGIMIMDRNCNHKELNYRLPFASLS